MEPVLLAAAAIALAGYIYGYMTGRCSAANPCKQCSFHVNEQRMKRMAAAEERLKYKNDQEALRHDAAHKGWGWATNSPDKFNCPDASCSRNKRV